LENEYTVEKETINKFKRHLRKAWEQFNNSSANGSKGNTIKTSIKNYELYRKALLAVQTEVSHKLEEFEGAHTIDDGEDIARQSEPEHEWKECWESDLAVSDWRS